MTATVATGTTIESGNLIGGERLGAAGGRGIL